MGNADVHPCMGCGACGMSAQLKAVRNSGIPREEIFITSKLWPQDYGYEAAKKELRFLPLTLT